MVVIHCDTARGAYTVSVGSTTRIFTNYRKAYYYALRAAKREPDFPGNMKIERERKTEQ